MKGEMGRYKVQDTRFKRKQIMSNQYSIMKIRKPSFPASCPLLPAHTFFQLPLLFRSQAPRR